MNAPRPLLSLPSPLRLLVALIVLITGVATGTGITEAQNGVAAINSESAPAVETDADISPGHVGSNTALFDDGMLGCCVAPSAARHLCSFSGETEVLMADGTTKQISVVEVGDWVLAEDPETGERGAREVTHLWVHEDTIIDLEIDGHDVATTEDHPFWNHTDNEWQRADELDTGDLLLTAVGATLEVDGMDWRSARTAMAYNLAVDGIHTYFVSSGDEEILVHNECPLGLRLTSRGNYRSTGPLPSRDVVRNLDPLDRVELREVLETSIAGRRAELATADWLPDYSHLNRVAEEESLLNFINSLPGPG